VEFPSEEVGTDERSGHRARRLFEWFLFERDAECIGGLPVDALLECWWEEADEDLRALRSAYTESITGIFEILEGPVEGVLAARDLAGLTRLELIQPRGPASLLPGDLIVGRLFPVEGDLYLASPACQLFRSAELLAALIRDLNELRESRSRAVMRLSQVELERMFWGHTRVAGADSPQGHLGSSGPKDPVGELQEFLAQEGISEEVIQSWCRGLARSPQDAETLVCGVDDLVGQILDQLAFQTEMDLGRARALLLAAWPVLSAPDAGDATEDEVTGAVDISASLAEFDRDRAAGIDLETSFRELTRRLGLEDDDGDEDKEAPDFPGVVGAMIEEFLWETEQTLGPELRAEHEVLRLFGTYSANVGVFENLGHRDVLSFACFWIPESRQLKSGVEAKNLAAAMLEFTSWAASTQGVELLEEDLPECLAALQESLPRAVVANSLVERDETGSGELFEYLGVTQGALARIRDAQELEREVELDQPLLSQLTAGDLFRGYTGEDGAFVVACCYPPEAAKLRQSLA
jgi:hypothetical protein